MLQLGKTGNPQTQNTIPHHSKRSLISWRCTVLAIDCGKRLGDDFVFEIRSSNFASYKYLERFCCLKLWQHEQVPRTAAGTLLAHQPLGDQWQLPGGAAELTLFFDHQDRCKITRSFWEELSKRQQVRRWKSCKHQHTSTIFKMRMLFGVRPGVECNLLQGDLWGASCFGTCLTSGAWAQRHSRDSRGPKKEGVLVSSCFLAVLTCWHQNLRISHFYPYHVSLKRSKKPIYTCHVWFYVRERTLLFVACDIRQKLQGWCKAACESKSTFPAASSSCFFDVF